MFSGSLGLSDGVPSPSRGGGHKGKDPVGMLNNQRISLKRGTSAVSLVVRKKFHQRDMVSCGKFFRKGVGAFRSTRHDQLNVLRFLNFRDLSAEEVIVLKLTRTHNC